MEEPWASVLIALGSALAGIITTVVATYLRRDKDRAETTSHVAAGADEVVTSALNLVKTMQQDMENLRARVDELERENAELRCTVEAQGRTIAKLEVELEEYRSKETCECQSED